MVSRLFAVLLIVVFGGMVATGIHSCNQAQVDAEAYKQQAATNEAALLALQVEMIWRDKILIGWEQGRNEQKQILSTTKQQVANLSTAQKPIRDWGDTALPDDIAELLKQARYNYSSCQSDAATCPVPASEGAGVHGQD